MVEPSVTVAAGAGRFVVDRVGSLAPSPTIAVAKQAQELRKRGVDVVDFGPGEPDFDTPPHIREAAVGALREGFTHYTPGRGIPQLLEAIAGMLRQERGVSYDPATEIIVTPGAKQALVEAMVTAVQPGDEVILFDPCWGSYDAIVRLAGGEPVHVQLREDFTIDPELVDAALTARTRVVVVGSPGNPTGHVLTAEELELLARVCEERDLLLISDEIYDRIVYDRRPTSPASLPGMEDRTVTVNGFSKAYAMTGWRLGYAAAPAAFIREMLKVQEHTVTTATSFAQVGAVAALTGPQEPIAEMVAEFSRRRQIVVHGLNALPAVHCLAPDGAFYVFPNVSGTGLTGSELAQRCLGNGVALTPGLGFGEAWDTHVRLSFATSEERIRTGLERIGETLAAGDAAR
jgi:aspartate aminotransferase